MATYLVPGFPRSLFEALADQLGVDLVLETCGSGPDPGDDPFADGSYDLGWVCAPSYVELTQPPAPSVQLVGVAWVPDDPDAHGLPVYFADLLVPPGSSLASFEDLAGCRIGCNDPVSLSGHHSLRIAMRDRGHDPDTFAELIFTGGHQTSLDLLLAGELDAAVIDSVVRTARSRRESAVAELRVLERLGPWPVQALVARADLDRATVDSFRERLLKVESAQEVREELRRAALLGFVPVGTDYIEPVRIALAAAGS